MWRMYVINGDCDIILIYISIMKIPLRFQITEFDCWTVSLQNAISFLYEREDIPAELIREIAMYTLDCYDKKWNLWQWGTSRNAIAYLAKWIVEYSKKHDFWLSAIHKEGKDVTIDILKSFLKDNRVILLRTYLLSSEHYVIITKIHDDFIYVWDPYFLDAWFYDNDKDVDIILGRLFDYNRRISLKRFVSCSKKDFALGPFKWRECTLIQRK